MQPNSYRETIDWLFLQFPSFQAIGASAYKPDLGNIRLLCALFENPEVELSFIHIAGTNGKGSTSSMLASILTESGEKVGLFTSPHIIDFRERIRVNGIMISEKNVIAFCDTLRNAKLKFEPSFFEITFTMALIHFRAEKCSICVIETGLGGRLDATNIISPLLSIITNISLEHTQFLGNTLTEISREKAGIIKPKIPVVIGETTAETKIVFAEFAKKNDSEVIWCEDIPLDPRFKTPLLGKHQRINLHTVICALNQLKTRFLISETAINAGLTNLFQNTGLIGRMQVIESCPLTILDVSHNVDGVKKTLETIETINKGKLHIIYGTSSDKNYIEIVSLFPKNAQINFCTFTSQRSLSLNEMELLGKKMNLSPLYFTNIKEAIKTIQTSANKDDTILAFGSFYLISDFF
jgi:dihydrofolate synthase/folylpolyglutamate synthase